MPRPDFEILRKKEKLPKPAFTEKAPLLLMQAILPARRAQYGLQTAEQDRGTIVQIQTSQDRTLQAVRRRLMALQVVIGEKEVLQEAAQAVAEQLAELSTKDGKKKKRPHMADTTLEEQLIQTSMGKKQRQ